MVSLEFENIFDAITDSKAEANSLQLRANFMLAIRGIVDDKKLNQTDISEKLGLSQTRVNDLLSGKVDKFTIDQLMTCLYCLGFCLKPIYENSNLTVTVKTA